MAHDVSTTLEQMSQRLATVSSTVARQALAIAPTMQAGLAAADLSRWMQYCVQLAQSGWRSWESTAAFLQVSPFLLHRLPPPQLWEWAEHGQILARASAEVASAFFQAAKPFLHHTTQTAFLPWVEGGHWYMKHHPTASTLAATYFQLSAQLYGHYAPSAVQGWHQLGQALAQFGRPQVQAFFAVSQAHLDHSPDLDHIPAWAQAQRLLPQTPDIALLYLERYADLVQRFGVEGMARIHTLMGHVLRADATRAQTFLRQVGTMLALVPAVERPQALEWCQQIAAVSPSGVIDFLHHLDTLRRQLPGQHLSAWVATGIEVAQRHAPAGEAYFALESAAAQDRLHTLQNLVTFATMAPVLQLYTEAMLGRPIPVRTTADLPSGLQQGGRDLPTSDGSTIFVPPQVGDFATERENFAAYKVAILHQIGFYESGTFTFRFSACVQRLPALQAYADVTETRLPGTAASFERFFAVFPQPALAQGLFTILEDARIDAALRRRYKGIGADLTLIMQHSLAQRPALHTLPLRQALLEGLLQLTLGASAFADVSPILPRLLQRLAIFLRPLSAPGATVYDTAAAVLTMYRLLTQIPLQAGTTFMADAAADVATLEADLLDDADTIALADMFRAAGDGADSMPTLPESTEPASGIDPVPYRGDVKPELVQKKLRLNDLTETLEGLADDLSPLSPEALKQLLENSDIDIKSLQAGNLDATSGLFVSDLEGREGIDNQSGASQEAAQEVLETLRADLDATYGALTAQKQTFLYDEWDYTIGDYRRAWCRLSETVLDDEGTTFVEDTRQQYADLLAEVSRQFQRLKPELFKKIKRLTDGEDIDLDSAVEAVVDRRAGNLLSDRVYMRRNKRDRSVAAVFLLDMSASTDDEITEPAADQAATAAPITPRLYDFSGFIQDDHYAILPPWGAKADPPRRRIIDVEKEALVLMAEALETLGDAYAVYGFSGYGRGQVDAFVVKAFDEPYNTRIQGRIGAIKPHRSTRMGPAIRHALRQLGRQEARIKTLLLLSDGYPQDFDYGKDRKSKDYGIQDTMMALHEARLQGVQTFCITVDPAGHDYLRQMCPDQQYLVIEDIRQLPQELPKVYRGLTT